MEEHYDGAAESEIEDFNGRFAQFMLSYEFVADLARWAEEEGHDEVAGRARDLASAVADMSVAVEEGIASEQQSIEEFYSDAGRQIDGFLNLERDATIESLSVSFGQRFGDREWQGFPHPVSQHVGGSNAEVTLEITTNDRLLLDQLGQMKRAQEAMAELRKSVDVVPALLDVFGEGNLLRSLGIKRLAYQSHTRTVSDQNPGYYQIRLDLIQDEETLPRSESLADVGGLQSDQFFEMTSVKPLLIPASGEDGEIFDARAPVSAAQLLSESWAIETAPARRVGRRKGGGRKLTLWRQGRLSRAPSPRRGGWVWRWPAKAGATKHRAFRNDLFTKTP